MSGWHYPDDGHGPWDGPAYDDRDYPDPQELAEMEFWNEKRHYPRGYGPPYEGEDWPSVTGDPFHVDDEAPDERYIHDPGFSEEDTMTEDHRVGAILRQAEQWPERVAWGNQPPPKKKPKKTPSAPVQNDDVFIMPGEQSGLYGEDEDHPYPAVVKKSPQHGPKAYDVLKPL